MADIAATQPIFFRCSAIQEGRWHFVSKLLKGIDMTRKEFKNEDGSKSNLPKPQFDTSGCVLLADIHQQQDHQVSLEITAGSLEYIRGPIDMIKWKEVHTFHDALKSAIARAGLAPVEQLVSAPYLLRQQSGWNPGMQLWADTTSNDIDLQKINVIVTAVLAGVQRDAANDTLDIFFDTVLDSVQKQAVREVIFETLVFAGGKKLMLPMHVQVGKQSQTIKGKLGAKPSLANFHPDPMVFTGTFDGFSLEKRELTFKVDEKIIHLNFEKEIVNLIEVAVAASEKRVCAMRTHRTISARGEDVHAFLPEGAFRRLAV